MTQLESPIVVKRYANRRLYNAATGAYVTLEDLVEIIKTGRDFTVCDGKTGKDITRSTLAQIIIEQENRTEHNLLPIMFLRQLALFYGDIMQVLVSRYLEVSIDSLVREQERLRLYINQALGTDSFAPLDDLVRHNMEMFKRTFAMLASFAPRPSQAAEEEAQIRASDNIGGFKR